MQETDWFKEWFDTGYYHLLYNKRNDDEALDFISKLVHLLRLPAGAKVADIACGKGRHSRVLAARGFEVCGFDLSHNSIAWAKAQNTPHTSFFEHDMRLPFPEQNFNAAFNLFTSFGYFDDPADDDACLANVFQMLSPGGYFVQDYLNGEAFTSLMPVSGSEIRGDISFHYQKEWNPPFIEKFIEVKDGETSHHYQEKVKVYSLKELEMLHLRAGFEILHVFGDYQLGEFAEIKSPRIIIISKKPHA